MACFIIKARVQVKQDRQDRHQHLKVYHEELKGFCFVFILEFIFIFSPLFLEMNHNKMY